MMGMSSETAVDVYKVAVWMGKDDKVSIFGVLVPYFQTLNDGKPTIDLIVLGYMGLEKYIYHGKSKRK